MRLMEQSGRGFALRTAITVAMVCAAVLVTMRVGNAERGGATRNALSFAGTLRRSGACAPETTLTFRFKKRSAPTGPFVAVAGCAPEARAMPAAGTCAFQVEISMSGCPAGMFDGDEVVFDVTAGADVVAAEQQVNPVPYAKYADRVGTPDCPVGYDHDERETAIMLCRKCRGPGRFDNCYDDVVRVGTGASAFWIDRYEASVWETTNATDGQRLENEADIDEAVFPRNGQWVRPYYALSRIGVEVARSTNWFMASAACRASEKRLPTDDEWIAAARRTIDPGPNNGLTPPNGRCHTLVTAGQGFRRSGLGTDCQSAWGVQDMIGNVREWISAWVGSPESDPSMDTAPTWEDRGGSYFSDGIDSVTSWVYPGGPGRARGPAAPLRGGGITTDRTAALRAGIFGYALYAGPSNWDLANGFRCVIPR